MCGIIAMCYLASEVSQKPGQPAPFPIALEDTGNLPNAENSVLCQGKDKIIAALGKLLMKLMGEETFWNGTVGNAKGKMATTLTEFLNLESIYRLAQGTEKSSIQTATYTLEKIEQLRAEKESQEKVVKEKTVDYPVEKSKIDADRELILTLIKMVESIGAEDENTTASTRASPEAAKAELHGLQSDLQLFQAIGSHLAASGGGGGSPVLSSALRQLGSLERRGKGMMLAAPTAEEIRSTRNQVKSVLLTLLQDPAFRQFLLDSGMADAVEGLLTVNEKIAEKEETAATMFKTADEAKATIASTAIDRSQVAGKDIAAKTDLEIVSGAATASGKSRRRQRLLLMALMRGIDGYCATGVMHIDVPES